MKNPIENRTLFTGDNLEVMRAMNSETVDLIYLDPPFNKKFVFPIGKGDAAEFGFKDIWGWDSAPDEGNPFLPYAELYAYDELLAAAAGGNPLMDARMSRKIVTLLETMGDIAGHAEMAYLSFMAARLVEMRRVLKPTGSIYLHCDQTMSHSLKLLMDVVFGDKNFRNEIVWCYSSTSQASRWFPRKHDNIFFYAKGERHKFNKDAVRIPFKKPLVRHGKTWKSADADKLAARTRQGKIAEDFWTDIYPVNSVAKERAGYPTQKPLALLERIITASSDKGGLVLDPFCGCATTCIAAEKLDRQWIGIDISSKAAGLVKYRLTQETKQGALSEGMRIVHHRRFDKGDCPMRTDMGETRSKNIKKILYGEQAGKCNLCKNHMAIQYFHVDHIVPRAKGGPDCDRNLQLLCGPCNAVKSTRTMETARKRLRELGHV